MKRTIQGTGVLLLLGTLGLGRVSAQRPDSTKTAAVSDTAAGHRHAQRPGRRHPAAAPCGSSGKSAAPRATRKDSVTTASAGAAPTDAKAPARGAESDTLAYDPATNTVTFKLIAGPFNFNGYTNGKATLSVPPKATVLFNFVNQDGTPHSAEVIDDKDPMPNLATDPALPRAYTNRVAEGLPQGAGDLVRFTVPESGSYRIFCGVPGHGLSGMWIRLKVDPSAKSPSFTSTPS